MRCGWWVRFGKITYEKLICILNRLWDQNPKNKRKLIDLKLKITQKKSNKNKENLRQPLLQGSRFILVKWEKNYQ